MAEVQIIDRNGLPPLYRFRGIEWAGGSEFNSRIHRALMLIDSHAARRYYFTTVTGK